MEVASVSELKAHLSTYLRMVRRRGSTHLRMVRRGGEVRISTMADPSPDSRGSGLGAPAGADDEHREALMRAGLIRPSRRDPMSLLDEPPLKLPVDLRHAAAEARADRV